MHARAKGPRLRKIDVRVPELSVPIETRSPLLDEREYALLRRIDGQATVNALASSMHLADVDVARALAKMERLRLVRFLARRRTVSSSPAVRLRSGVRPALDTLPSAEPPLSSNTAEEVSAEVVALTSKSPATESPTQEEARALRFLERALVAAMCGQLGNLTHYEVLGIPKTAHSDEVTRAYFVLVSAIHSPRFAEASAGVRRDHVDAIRARATLAHDTLSAAERRAVYDVLLFSLARAQKGDCASEPPLGEANRSPREPRATLVGIGPRERGARRGRAPSDPGRT